jgi:hypothetical protein
VTKRGRYAQTSGRMARTGKLPMQPDRNDPATWPLIRKPESSRKLARLIHTPPLSEMTSAEHRKFTAAVETVTAFSDLSPQHARMVREAEANSAKDGAR